jgi:hypothetical protein
MSEYEKDSPEIKWTKCKICGELKKRIYAGLYPNLKDKRYIGEDGLLWSGLRCGPCQALNAKKNMKRLYEERKK